MPENKFTSMTGSDALAWQAVNQPTAFLLRETIEAGKLVRVRRYTCPLDKYLEAGRITEGQHAVGEAFALACYLAGRQLAIQSPMLGDVRGRSMEQGLEARDWLNTMFRRMAAGKAGQVGATVVSRVAGYGETVTAVERSLGLPRRHGRAMRWLRLGLDDLLRRR